MSHDQGCPKDMTFITFNIKYLDKKLVINNMDQKL